MRRRRRHYEGHALDGLPLWARRLVDGLEAEIRDFEQSFDLYDQACRDATRLWREEQPGTRGLVLPDQRALVRWLLDRMEALEEQVRRLESELDETAD